MARPGISTKNTEKIPPGPKFWNPKKIPPKYRKNTKIRIFGIFGVFFRYFRGILGVFLGVSEFPAGGYFFGIFRGNSGSGHSGLCSRSGRSQNFVQQQDDVNMNGSWNLSRPASHNGCSLFSCLTYLLTRNYSEKCKVLVFL